MLHSCLLLAAVAAPCGWSCRKARQQAQMAAAADGLQLVNASSPDASFTFTPPHHPCAASMHVYSGFWHLVGAAVKARYHELLSYEPDYGAIYTGVEKFLYNPTAGGLATHFHPASSPAKASLHLLPVAPFYLCAAAESVGRKGNMRVEELMGRVRFNSRNHMQRAFRGNAPKNLLCSAYESLLQWVGNHSHFTITAHRHVWSFPYAFYLTSAIVRDNATDERGSPAVPVNSAVDPYHVMRPGIFLTQEHRVGQPPPNVILIPFYSPPFFLFAGDEPRRTLLTSSSHHMTHCHRFDLFPRGGGRLWSCSDEAVRHSGLYRHELEMMAASLNETMPLRQPGAVGPCPPEYCGRCTGKSCPPTALLHKARMYRDSIYCVVVPGDSLITPRIFSYVQAGCVPLFPFAADYLRHILPLPHSIAWEELGLSVDLRLVSNWSRHGRPADGNPLRTILMADRQEPTRREEHLLAASRAVDFNSSALAAIALELAHQACDFTPGARRPWVNTTPHTATSRASRSGGGGVGGVGGGEGEASQTWQVTLDFAEAASAASVRDALKRAGVANVLSLEVAPDVVTTPASPPPPPHPNRASLAMGGWGGLMVG